MQEDDQHDLASDLYQLPGAGDDNTLPSLDMRRVHIHLPTKKHNSLTGPYSGKVKQYDTSLAKKEPSDWLINCDKGFFPISRLLADECTITYVEYDHTGFWFVYPRPQAPVEHPKLREVSRTTVSVAEERTNWHEE